MNTAIRLVLGVSVLAAAAGCSGSTDTNNASGGTGPIQIGGAGSGGSTSTTGGDSSGGGGGDLPPGVPLTPTNGWVDGASNTLGIQGAMFAFSDMVSGMGLVSDLTADHACIKGTAAKVDLKCTPVAPATDCYGQFWGAALGLNLKQPIDMTTMMGGAPAPFDASALKGFAFDITGMTIPSPAAFRFKVEDAKGEFCTPATKAVKLGPNVFNFSDLIAECWAPKATAATAETAKADLLKISWQVVTNSGGTVPFDFCVSNVRALN